MQLRPYQTQGFNQIFNEWEWHDVVMFLLATGGGKTVTFTEVIRQFNRLGAHTLLIAHREELIVQAQRTLQVQGINSGIIKAEYPVRPEFCSQVGSIQTLISRKKSLQEFFPHFELIVIDEGHHVQDDNSYGTILQMYPRARVLIVTATSYRLSGKGFKYVYPGKPTKLVINLTLKQAIEEAWLVPIKYCIGSIPDLNGLPLVKGEYEEDAARKAMELAPLVESYHKYAAGMCGIVFAVNVEHSLFIVDQYNKAGIPAAHVDANTSLEERAKMFNSFKKGFLKVISNVAILTEGTDFPNCEFVQLAAPGKSLSNYLQKVGRVTRILTGVIDSLATIEERTAAISASRKPFGLILDNAGQWQDHGFPDDDHNWNHYFEGWKKQKEEKIPEGMMEMTIFEVEDPKTGERRKTNNINEVPGMILVEVTKELRENLQAQKHIKEFEKIYKFALESDKIKQPGYFTFHKFLDYCTSMHLQVSQETWKYIRTRLVDDIEYQVTLYVESQARLGIKIVPAVNLDVARIRSGGIASGFFRVKVEQYKQSREAVINNLKNKTI